MRSWSNSERSLRHGLMDYIKVTDNTLHMVIDWGGEARGSSEKMCMLESLLSSKKEEYLFLFQCAG
jgi:hypothetical protein